MAGAMKNKAFRVRVTFETEDFRYAIGIMQRLKEECSDIVCDVDLDTVTRVPKHKSDGDEEDCDR